MHWLDAMAAGAAGAVGAHLPTGIRWIVARRRLGTARRRVLVVLTGITGMVDSAEVARQAGITRVTAVFTLARLSRDGWVCGHWEPSRPGGGPRGRRMYHHIGDEAGHPRDTSESERAVT